MIIPMMMLAAMPIAADAQNKSGLVLSNRKPPIQRKVG